jgi:streptogramin lyase
MLAGPRRGLPLISSDIERLREVAVGAPFALDRLCFADYELPARVHHGRSGSHPVSARSVNETNGNSKGEEQYAAVSGFRQRDGHGVPRFVARSIAIAACALLVGALVTARPRTAVATGIESVTDYPVPGGQPWGTAFDGAGRVWVAMPGCDPSPTCASSTPPGKLARFDPGTRSWSTVVSLPAGYGQPLFVAVDQAGRVWFTMPVTNAIGLYNPVDSTVRQWPVPTVSAGPWGLAVDSRGKVWFTEHYVNKIGSFDPTSQSFQEISTSAANSNPYGIAVDSVDNVWFTENTDSVARIGRYTAQGILSDYKVRSTSTAGTGLTPHLITIDRNGNVWWSEGWVSGIGTLNLALAVPGTSIGVTEYRYTPACGSCGSHTSGIAADTQGLIWLDDSLQNTFGSFPAGGGAFSFFQSPGNHPHDGLNVDSQNRIWFDEEFSNRLAVAVQSGSSTTTTTGSSTSTTTTTTPGSGTVLAADGFQRADQAFWGRASDGQTWGGDANSRSAFSVSGGAGRVTNTGSTSYSAVLGPAAADTEVYATASISSFASSNFGNVLRWRDGNNWYKAYTDGANLFIQKRVGGVTTMLASRPFTATAGTSYTIHFRAVGANLTANIWLASSSEPSTWMLTATDTTFASGFAGMRILTNAGTATVTSFQAKSL